METGLSLSASAFTILLLFLLSCFTFTSTSGSILQAPTTAGLNQRLSRRLLPTKSGTLSGASHKVSGALSGASHKVWNRTLRLPLHIRYPSDLRFPSNHSLVLPYRKYAFEPTNNITIKWDVISWTPDGYVADVTLHNFENRSIEAPGWTLGWRWAKNEVIWSMMGGQATDQGNCSKYFKGNIPHCCRKDPIVVDLSPQTPKSQRIANCCKGGVLSSWEEDPANATSSFQVSVGEAGTSRKTVRVPRGFILKAPGTPGPWYTCGPAKTVWPTQFVTPHKYGLTQAIITWRVTCMYSRFVPEVRLPTYNPFLREPECWKRSF